MGELETPAGRRGDSGPRTHLLTMYFCYKPRWTAQGRGSSEPRRGTGEPVRPVAGDLHWDNSPRSPGESGAHVTAVQTGDRDMACGLSQGLTQVLGQPEDTAGGARALTAALIALTALCFRHSGRFNAHWGPRTLSECVCVPETKRSK